MNKEEVIRKNKRILGTAVISLVAICFIAIMFNSEYNSDWYFHFVHNQNTGEPLSLIASILLYILFWWFAGLVPSAAVFLFMLILHSVLHRKEEKNGKISPEEDFYYGGYIAFISTYAAILVLMLLHIFNIITVNVF